MDTTAVKAEIKNWEHEFRARNGRSATIEDVKALPRIAEKYKLYKRLIKEVEHNKRKTNEVHTPPSRVSVQDVASPSVRQHAAIAKARKRLRGESVSPSPLPRDKRRRENALDLPPQDRHSQERSVSPPNQTVEAGDGFVNDSPVKTIAGGKAFTPLFEEAIPLSQSTHSKTSNVTARGGAFSRAKTLPSNLFGSSLPAASTSIATEVSRKRTLSKVVEHDIHKSHDERHVSNRWHLLPPSPPPPQDDTGWYNAKGKEKTRTRDKGHNKAKKAKLSAADEEEKEKDDARSSDDADVKIVAWRGGPRSPQRQERDSKLTVDPELQFHRRTWTLDTPTSSASSSLEKFEVDLPEEIRRVLALSSHDVERGRKEEYLVKRLMRGRRRAGGEVWAPGEIGGESETSEEGVHAAEEEDWEGEGVPWEVAEL